MGGKASNYNVAVYFSNSKDSNVSSESVNQPWHEYHADIYNLWSDMLCNYRMSGYGYE